MPVQLAVQAEVVDLRLDTPLPTDRFLIDTNVWFWTTYSWANQTAHPYQIEHYPNFLNRALRAPSSIYFCTLTFAELTHAIEHAEWTIYKGASPSKSDLPLKEYRHNDPSLRADVVAEIQSAWGIITAMAQPLDLTIDLQMTDAALARLSVNQVDGYDLFILEAMQRHGISQVVTDDGDFATVPGIQVFTANINVLALAPAQGKLIAR